MGDCSSRDWGIFSSVDVLCHLLKKREDAVKRYAFIGANFVAVVVWLLLSGALISDSVPKKEATKTIPARFTNDSVVALRPGKHIVYPSVYTTLEPPRELHI